MLLGQRQDFLSNTNEPGRILVFSEKFKVTQAWTLPDESIIDLGRSLPIMKSLFDENG